MYLFISILVLILSYFLFKKASGSLSLTKLNMISWIFYYNIIMQSFIAAILVVNKWDNHYLISRITRDDTRFNGWIAVMYTSMALPIGMILMNKILSANPKNLLDKYQKSSLVPLVSKYDSYIKYPLFLLSSLSIIAVLYTFANLREIPILKAFSGASAYDLAVYRELASRRFQGNEIFRNIFAISLTPLLCFIYCAYYRCTKKKIDLHMFYIMFIFTFLILTYDLEKSPIINFLIGFVFFKVLVDRDLSKKMLYIYGAGVFIILVFMYVLVMQSGDIYSLFSNYNAGILGRIFLTQSAGTYLMFDIFPRVHDFIGFNSVSSFIASLSGDEVSDRAARIVMSYIRHGNLEGAGVVNSLFVGEAWANFGWTGVLLSPLYVGAVVQFLYIKLLKSKKTPLFLGVLVYFSYKSSITGGFNDYIYNVGYFILFIMIAFVYISGKSLKR
ncbi:oligosaccharide repeat unit polymerase [Riemerella columbipharyngis]|uniref:Oligosaccharide repeat unit polymerase n=2 Tax=Riemerella columbipharyngis TaxID=1071918 RepID=A0A1G6YY56_9FLAO|nr:oligosaccharide repeat unit polymerase [Riemerella columbipharyngis]